VLGSLETMKGDKEDGHGAEGTMTREQLLTDPEQAADFVKLTQCDALAIAIGTSHGAYKFSKKPTGDILPSTHQGNPPAHSEHPSGDARFVVGAAGTAGGNPRIRRRHEGNLRRAGRRNSGRHQARRAQGQYRHRPASGDDRRDPPLHGGKSGQVRPARLPEAGARSGEEGLPRAFRRFRREGQAGKIKPVSLDKIAEKYKSGGLAQVVH
jgi:fructose-bisphosphate aldolase class II